MGASGQAAGAEPEADDRAGGGDRLRLEAVLALAPVALFELDAAGRFTAPPVGAASAALAADAGELVGRSVFDVHADQPGLLAAVRRALAGEPARGRATIGGRALEVACTPVGVAGGGRPSGAIGVAREAALAPREGDERFRSLVENMQGMLFGRGAAGDGPHGYDGDGVRVWGRDAAALCGVVDGEGRAALDRWVAAIHPDDQPAYLAAEARRKATGEPFRLEFRTVHPETGEVRWVREVAWAVRDPASGRVWLDDCMIDVTEEKRTEAALRESNDRYRQLIEGAPVAILIYREGRCVYANPAALALLGAADAGAMLGRRLTDLVEAPGRQRRAAASAALAATTAAAGGPRELLCRRLDGHRVWVEVSAAEIVQGGAPALQLVLVDLTARRRAEATMRHIAHHDPLTGLPNRLLLMDRLSQAIARARREREHLALMILDLDGFKEVNDTLGHAAGDDLLCQVARRVRRTMRASDTLARLGGDEFAVVQLGLDPPRDAAMLADKIIDALSAPFLVDNQEVRAGTSIGVSLFPDDGQTPGALLKQADLALYRAKDAGRNRACFFAPELDAVARSRRVLAAELRAAFERGDLALVYQTQVDLGTRATVGAEALLRWRDRERGEEIPPERFVRVAESTGLIRAMGAWVLDRACAQARRWGDAGSPWQVAVNVAAAQLRDPGFRAQVAATLDRHGLPPGRLCLELTEGLLAAPLVEEHGGVIARLAELGVRIAIDDFGTGYSSLLNLKRLPVHQIKIDRSFVADIGVNPDSEAIIRATVQLAHGLGKRAVAEAVETEAQHRFLAGLGCDLAQGFLYARPRPAENLLALSA